MKTKLKSISTKKVKSLVASPVSPGRDGVPDRIVIIRGNVIFVEVKTSDGKLSTAQKREHERLESSGTIVYTVYGEEGVDSLMGLLCMI